MGEFERRNPVSGECVWRGEAVDAAAVREAVRTARKAFPAWANAAQEERVAVARRFADALREEANALADAIGRETGKPRWEARLEVQSAIAKVELSIRAQVERAGEHTAESDGLRSVLRHRPHGVLAVLGPFNFPLHLPNGHIVPALLAGNAVVFKPSEFAPGVAERYLALWTVAGLPPGLLGLAQGGGATGMALAAEEGIDGLLFTGSAATGARLARQFGETPHRLLALEMGGNNPLVVWEPGDVSRAALVVLQSAFLSAGQRCTCARRLIVPRGPEGDAVIEALLGWLDGVRIGAWDAEPEPFMGAVVTPEAALRLCEAQDKRVAHGAAVLRPLRVMRAGTGLLSPGVLDVTGLASLPDEELFGPLLQVQRARDFDQAIALANATRFGLAAGLLSADPARFETFRLAARAGIVNWNRPLTGASSGLPFGGIGASGNHRPSAWYAADYCAYPVAGQEAPSLPTEQERPPGLGAIKR